MKPLREKGAQGQELLLTATQHRLLYLVRKPITGPDLVRLIENVGLNIPASNRYSTLQRMASVGWIEVTMDQTDPRNNLYCATEAGMKVLRLSCTTIADLYFDFNLQRISE